MMSNESSGATATATATENPIGAQNDPSLLVAVGSSSNATNIASKNNNSAARKPVQMISPPSSKRLRSGFLNKLGIVDDRLALPPLNDHSSNTNANTISVLGPQGQIRVLKAPLKTNNNHKTNKQPSTPFADPGLLGVLGSMFKVGSPTSSMDSADNDDEAYGSPSPSTLEDSNDDGASAARRRPKLTFNETVSVVHIPTRHEYSKRIKGCLWEPGPSLQENIMRNTIEFAAEGWDWRSVLEEDDHIPCPESGELIHPVHCEIARLIRQERGLPEETDSVMDLLNSR